jgi:predicted GNAT superfamily acetyltransferase
MQFYTFQNHISEPHKSAIIALYQSVFKVENTTKFLQRIENEHDILFLLAYENDELAGFKIGYQKSETVFYSWLGAVHSAHRRKGIADELMRLQHDWCSKNGYQKIQTKTLNQWKSMLILNLQHGFDILETYRDEKGVLKIVLEKGLVYSFKK